MNYYSTRCIQILNNTDNFVVNVVIRNTVVWKCFRNRQNKKTYTNIGSPYLMTIWSATVCSYVSTEQMLLMSSLQSYSHYNTLMSTESKFEHSAACLQLITAGALPPSTSLPTISALLATLHSDTPWQHWQCQQCLVWSRGSGPSAVSVSHYCPGQPSPKRQWRGR